MSSHKTDDIEITIKLSYSLAVLFTVLLSAGWTRSTARRVYPLHVAVQRNLVIAIGSNHRPPNKYTLKKRPDGS